MNDLHLRPLTSDLVEAAVALDQLVLRGLWTAAGYHREVDSPNAILMVLQSDQQDTPPLLALGCIWTILEEAHLTLLAVHPDYQTQGLGQALLVELIAEAWHRGMEWVVLEVRESNQKAIALYEKLDFSPIGYRKRYYQNPEEDAVLLWNHQLKESNFSEILEQWRRQVCDRLYQFGWGLRREFPPKDYPSV